MTIFTNPLARATPAHLRLWEVDWLRGIAIMLVIYYHLMFDLQHFGLIDIDWKHITWKAQAKVIKSMFLLLVGMSLQLSVTAAWAQQGRSSGLYQRYLLRGGSIFAIAMLITLATSFALPEGTIHFGILHAIGASLIITYPLLRCGYWLLLPAAVLFVLAFIIYPYRIDGYWLIWLGVLPGGYWTVDYAPLIPNLGIVFLGVCAARWLYPNNQRRFALAATPGNWVNLCLSRMGRHTLMLYLIHQPVLFAVFYILAWLGLIRFYA